jgi:hypothetical protein
MADEDTGMKLDVTFVGHRAGVLKDQVEAPN